MDERLRQIRHILGSRSDRDTALADELLAEVDRLRSVNQYLARENGQLRDKLSDIAEAATGVPPRPREAAHQQEARGDG